MSSTCLSTHGGAGYPLGSYWKDKKIVCGACKEEIINPSHSITLGNMVTKRKKGYRGWLLGEVEVIDRLYGWPLWVRGEKERRKKAGWPESHINIGREWLG